MDIQIGKFTLESLTTGMYSEPESCYREYIQNAVDSIDAAISQGILCEDDCRIEIIVDNEHRSISVKDNGTGIKKLLARNTLLDIGNSTKMHTSNRGFRGIGRLGGLSYCEKLSFCTTAQGENEKTLITFDCVKLRELLVPGQHSEHNLQSVLDAVTAVKTMPEQASAHYFIVKMENVDDIASLLDYDTVKAYISQVAPLPFRDRFYWGKQIKEHIKEAGYTIPEYPIFIGESFESLTQMYKPYKLTLDTSSRAGVSKDEIFGISYIELKDKAGLPIAFGWYADTGFAGTLVDERISGIRARQGNILIGGGKTLSVHFKEARFNAWSMGEIYVTAGTLIPNARRDDFEKNDAFSDFAAGFRSTMGTTICDKIRVASKARNNPAQKALTNAAKIIVKTENILTTGFNSTHEKEELADTLEATRKNLYIIPKNAPAEVLAQKVTIMERLSELSTDVAASSNYKAKKDITSKFSKAEKKVVQAMMEVLTRNFERATVDSLYKEFLEELKLGGK